MAAIVGYKGMVKLGSNQVANLDSWELPLSAEMYDITAFNTSGWKSVLPGLNSVEAKCSGNYDNSDTNGQVALQNAYLNGTSVSASLYVNATNSYQFTAFIKGLSVKTPVNGKVTVDYTLVASGAVSYS